MKMLTTLIMPTSGEAELLGHSIKTDRAAVKQIIGISPQESAAAMNLTARENLELMAEVYGLSKKVAKAKASELIERFCMREFENRKAKRLSGGEVRILSIAMALISEPKILFLDEPTLGLDVIARHSLWVEIEKLKAEAIEYLDQNEIDEYTCTDGKVTYREVLSNRFQSTEFKKAHADLYEAFTKKTSSMRFTCN